MDALVLETQEQIVAAVNVHHIMKEIVEVVRLLLLFLGRRVCLLRCFLLVCRRDCMQVIFSWSHTQHMNICFWWNQRAIRSHGCRVQGWRRGPEARGE